MFVSSFVVDCKRLEKYGASQKIYRCQVFVGSQGGHQIQSNMLRIES